MKNYIYLFVCFYTFSFSQSIERLRMSDTVYVNFKSDKNQYKNSSRRDISKNTNYYFYIGYYETATQVITLINDYKLSPEVIIVNKSFLKNKKDLFIDYEFMTKYGNINTAKFLRSKKKIYILDDDDNCLFNIKLREVIFPHYDPGIE